MRYLIGIDDTDNPDSRGTGFRARQLSGRLAEAGLAVTRGITRHQLLVHPDIPYTSHNSSACLDVDLTGGELNTLADFCRDYLAAESAPGSDAGLCVAAFDGVAEIVVEFGRSAKQVVLTREEARELAARVGLHLEGVTGDHMGMIGALSAVGLRKSGHDGRFIWLKGVRELSGTASAGHLLEATGIDSVETVDGKAIPKEAEIRVDPWPRPVLLNGRAVLLAQEKRDNNAGYDWELLPKEAVRRY
ncbi:MAG: hypothetical protein OEW88_12915 [Gammaproteobacteria bacterium]|jgi:hypothetical protein|nr:hypothetical protein [Gammaproteobacteria bacterium]